MESQKPNFTIFIPTYNSETYIQSCIESALSQDYHSFDIVVLDSGSNDATLSILENYAIQDKRIEIVKTEKRLNIVENWNRIEKTAKTEWITILGHDDLLNSNFLSEMTELIIEHPNSNLFTSQFDIIDSNSLFYRKSKPIPEVQESNDYVKSRFMGTIDSFATGYVIRTSSYKQIGGIPNFPDLLFSDDALWVTLSFISPIICSKETLFKYRFHDKSTSGTPSQVNLIDAAILYLEFLNQRAKQDLKLKDILLNNAKNQMLPLAKGYIGLTLIRKSYLGMQAVSEDFDKVHAIHNLIGEKSDNILKTIKIRILISMNRSFLNKSLARLLFLILPSYKKKAGL